MHDFVSADVDDKLYKKEKLQESFRNLSEFLQDLNCGAADAGRAMKNKDKFIRI